MAKPTQNLKEQLEAATQKRDDFVTQANQQIAFLNGRIAMLEELINPPASTDSPPETDAAEEESEQPQK